MNKLITTSNGGIPIVLDDLRWFLGQSLSDSGMYQALNGILVGFGTDYIVSGCTVAGSDISDGWIMLDGELLKVDAHTKSDSYYVKTTSYDSSGLKTLESGSTANTYEKNRGVCSASSGTLMYNSPTLNNILKGGIITTITTPGTYDIDNYSTIINVTTDSGGTFYINLPDAETNINMNVCVKVTGNASYGLTYNIKYSGSAIYTNAIAYDTTIHYVFVGNYGGTWLYITTYED